jgi:hypothetical protein
MTTTVPAPAYILARAAWVPTLVIWQADGRFSRLGNANLAARIPRPGRPSHG